MFIKIRLEGDRFEEVWAWDWSPWERLWIVYEGKRWAEKPLLRRLTLEVCSDPQLVRTLHPDWFPRLRTLVDLCGAKWDERHRLLQLIDWAEANRLEEAPPEPPPPPSAREVKLLQLAEAMLKEIPSYKRRGFIERLGTL